MSAVDVQIRRLLKDWMSRTEGKHYHNRPRNGCGMPLSSWMASAKTDANTSKIEQVTSGLVNHKYSTFGQAVLDQVNRMAARYDLTATQVHAVRDIVQYRYRGRVPERPELYLGTFNSKIYVNHIANDCIVANALTNACRSVLAKKPNSRYPLGFLLDRRLTDLLLLQQLEWAAMMRRRNIDFRRTEWTQHN